MLGGVEHCRPYTDYLIVCALLGTRVKMLVALLAGFLFLLIGNGDKSPQKKGIRERTCQFQPLGWCGRLVPLVYIYDTLYFTICPCLPIKLNVSITKNSSSLSEIRTRNPIHSAKESI